jgi:hypothetical protein
MKARWYDFLWWIGEKVYEFGYSLQERANMYWRDYCPSCGMEGGYGHKDDCKVKGE